MYGLSIEKMKENHDSPFWILKDLQVSVKIVQTLTNPSALQPGTLFKLPGKLVPFRLLLKHSPSVKLSSCGHLTSSKDRSKSFPKVRLRRLLGNGTWTWETRCYDCRFLCHMAKLGEKKMGLR